MITVPDHKDLPEMPHKKNCNVVCYNNHLVSQGAVYYYYYFANMILLVEIKVMTKFQLVSMYMYLDLFKVNILSCTQQTLFKYT